MIVPSAAFLNSPSLAEAVTAWETWRQVATDPAEARRLRFLQEWHELKAEEERPRRWSALVRRCGDGLVRVGERLRSWSEAGAPPPRTA